MSNTIKNTLWKTLHDRQLIPGYDDYTRSVSYVNLQGHVMWSRMQKTKNGARLKKLMQRRELKLNEADVIRVLGFGVVITEYLIAPLSVPAGKKADALYAGALANMLVTLFDHFTDNRLIRDFRLTDVTLRSSNSGIAFVRYGLHYLQSNSCQRLISLLIREYYGYIQSFSDPVDKNVQQKKGALRYLIGRMYESEKQTILQPGNMSSTRWRHKSALPFLAMGLPAAFLVSPDRELWLWHIRWMYAFGDLIGLVDDAVDYTNDMRTGSPNIYNILRPHSATAPETIRYFSDKIADRICTLHAQFCKHTAAENRQIAWLPMVLISSWYGGVSWKPSDELNHKPV